MKKRWIALGIAVLAGAGGYQAFQANKYRLPGIVQDWRDPVQPNRAVAWQPGPAAPPAGQLPPHIILIVADDPGYNDISLNGGGVAGGLGQTPNIDAMARKGLGFTTADAPHPTRSPDTAQDTSRKPI